MKNNGHEMENFKYILLHNKMAGNAVQTEEDLEDYMHLNWTPVMSNDKKRKGEC